MKSTKRPYGPQPRNPHKDSARPSFNTGNKGGRDRRGGRDERPPARAPKPMSERPSTMVVQVIREGAYLRGRVLQRDLVNMDFEVIEGELQLNSGDFVEVKPESPNGKTLLAIKKVPASEAATWAAVCNHALRYEWPEEVEKEVEKLKAYTWKAEDKREDWRKLPIVTIDGADARDFDDAVWAEPWETDGHHIIVAIADVAHYIKEGHALDKEAVLRGNSTYFPDRVIPMLPERLSNDLCSLRPKEDRPVLGVEMWISAQGRLVKHAFKRGCIHSAARLTYEQVQSVFEGKPRDLDGRIQDALTQLRAAYATLAIARERRGALDLDIPEVKLEVKDGKITKVGVRPRLEAHRLIEELMILANVAAATTLSMKGGGLYRIHPEPSKEKLENLKASLGPLGFTVPAPNGGPKGWAKLVSQINEHPAAQTLLRAVLQSQSQAKYDANNIGHYGLALPLYSHFTSPIRRYADLVVHRALLQAMGIEKADSDEAASMVNLTRVADTINATERRSQQAEWESRDRMVAQHFAGLVGNPFEATIISVVPFGCFVSVEGVAEGLLPKWDLGRDWVYVGSLTCWRKTKGKGQLRVGNKVNVVLKEADALGGRLTFGLNLEKSIYVETQGRSFREDGTPVFKDSGTKEPRNRGGAGAKPARGPNKYAGEHGGERSYGRNDGRTGERRDERPARGERPASHFRSAKDGAPAHGDRPVRDARPERGERPARVERPSHDANGVPLERSARMEKPQWMVEKEAGRLRPLRPKTVKEVRAKLIADSKKVDRRKGAKPTTKPKRRS